MPRKECDAVQARLAATLGTDGAVLDEASEAHLATCDACAEGFAVGLESAPGAALATAEPAALLSFEPVPRPPLPVRILARLARLRPAAAGWIGVLLLLDAFGALLYIGDDWARRAGEEPRLEAAEEARQLGDLLESSLLDGLRRLTVREGFREMLAFLDGEHGALGPCRPGGHARIGAGTREEDEAGLACLAARLSRIGDRRPRIEVLPDPEEVQRTLSEISAVVSAEDRPTEILALAHVLSLLFHPLPWEDRRGKVLLLLSCLDECKAMPLALEQSIRERMNPLWTEGNDKECEISAGLGLREIQAGWRTGLLQSGWKSGSRRFCWGHPHLDTDWAPAPAAAYLAMARLEHVQQRDGYHAALIAALDPRTAFGTLVLIVAAAGLVLHALALVQVLWLGLVGFAFRGSLAATLEADPDGGARALRGLTAVTLPIAASIFGVVGGLAWWLAMGVASGVGFSLDLPDGSILPSDELLDRTWPTLLFHGSWTPGKGELMRLAVLASLGLLGAILVVDLRRRHDGERARLSWLLVPLLPVIFVTSGCWMGTAGFTACAAIFALTFSIRRMLPAGSLDASDRRRMSHVMAACLAMGIAQIAGLPAMPWEGIPFGRFWTDGVMLVTLVLAPVATGYLIAHLPAGQAALQRRLVGTAFLAPVLAMGPKVLIHGLEGGLSRLPVTAAAPDPGPGLATGYLAEAAVVGVVLVILGLVLGFRLAPEGAAAYARPPADEGWPRLTASLIRAGWAHTFLLGAGAAMAVTFFYHRYAYRLSLFGE